MLFRSKNPVMIAGQEIGAHDALDLAAELADVLGMPVHQESVPYRTAFRTDHPLYMGMLTRVQAQVRKVLDPHDVVFCLGADLLRMSVYSPVDPLPAHAQVAHLSERSWELAKNHAARWAACANVKVTLQALLPILRQRQTPARRDGVAMRAQRWQEGNWSRQREMALKAARVQGDASPMSEIGRAHV